MHFNQQDCAGTLWVYTRYKRGPTLRNIKNSRVLYRCNMQDSWLLSFDSWVVKYWHFRFVTNPTSKPKASMFEYMWGRLSSQHNYFSPESLFVPLRYTLSVSSVSPAGLCTRGFVVISLPAQADSGLVAALLLHKRPLRFSFDKIRKQWMCWIKGHQGAQELLYCINVLCISKYSRFFSAISMYVVRKCAIFFCAIWWVV